MLAPTPSRYVGTRTPASVPHTDACLASIPSHHPTDPIAAAEKPTRFSWHLAFSTFLFLLLLSVAPAQAGRIIQEFNLPLGTWVVPNHPGPGAGIIENDGDRDLYFLDLNIGQKLFFEDRGADTSLQWQLFDPKGKLIFTDSLDYSHPPDLIVSLPGTYSLYVQASDNAPSSVGQYSIRVWGDHPLITAQPVTQRRTVGESATFTVVASAPPGFGALTYQWRRNGIILEGRTEPLLRLSPITPEMQGDYDVVVANTGGIATSIAAKLWVDNSAFSVRDISPSGLLNKQVSQFEIQFSDAVKASSLTLADISLIGPEGEVSLSTATLESVSPSRYRLTLRDPLVEGGFSLEVGLNIQDVANRTLQGGRFLQAYPFLQETQEKSYWSKNNQFTNSQLGTFMGPYANNELTLHLPQLPLHEAIRVTWDLAILGAWEGEAGPNLWGFQVNSGTITPAWEFSFSNGDGSIPQSYPAPPVAGPADLFGFGSIDTLYRAIQQDLLHTNSDLQMRFYGRNLQFANGLQWGLGGMRIEYRSATNEPYRGLVFIDHHGPSIATNAAPLVFKKPADRFDLEFSEPIDPDSVDVDDFLLVGPAGTVPMDSFQRLDATHYRVFFPKQRINTNYLIRVGPGIRDAATNPMDQNQDGTNGTPADVFTEPFHVLVPPNVLTPAKIYSVVRNTNLTFSVSYEATEPVTFQWTRNLTPIPDQTNATLILTNVQPDQAGAYRIIVTDAGGSTLSPAQTLDVRFSYGILITQELARLPIQPKIPGNGVNVELFNGIGGGSAPTPVLLRDRKPTDAFFSPEIDFPKPGSLVGKFNRFQSFFTNTIIVPESVNLLTASNFVLRNTFLLNVQPDLDRFPDTPEIDLQIGIGSDDGFHLSISNRFLISTGDRAYNYSYVDLSFEAPGLYPVTLLYAGNASPTSGLEMNWLVSSNTVPVIIPQSRLYCSGILGDALLQFDQLESGTELGSQYRDRGILFSSTNLLLTANSNETSRLIPVSKPQVASLASTPATQPAIMGIRFVQPGTDIPAVTPSVSFFLLDAESPGTWVRAYDVLGNLIFEELHEGGIQRQELVTIVRSRTHRITIQPASSDAEVGIDHLVFVTPQPILDLTATEVSIPLEVSPGRRVQVSWKVANLGTEPIQGYRASLFWSPFLQETNLIPVTSLLQPATIPVEGATTGSTTITIPIEVSDAFFLTLQLESLSGTDVSPENNFRVAGPIQARIGQKPDLSPDSISNPQPLLSAGSKIPFVVTFQNGSPYDITQSWSSVILAYIPTNSTTPVEISRLNFDQPVLKSTQLSFTQSVNIPFTLSTGQVRFAVLLDAANAVDEDNETNNLLFASVDSIIGGTLGVTVSTNVLIEGGTPLEMILLRNGDLSDSLVVNLTNSRPDRINIPSPLKFLPGEASLLLSLSVPDDNSLPLPDIESIIGVTSDGYSPAFTRLLLKDNDRLELEMSAAPQLVPASAGPDGVQLSLSLLTPPLSVALDVHLRHASSNLVSIPELAVLNAGETNTVVSVNILSDSNITTNTLVQVQAFLPAADGQPEIALAQTSFTVRPDEIKSFALEILKPNNAELEIRHTAQLNRTYILEISTNLVSWIPVATNVAKSTPLSQRQPFLPSDPPTFIRVRTP